MLETTCRSWNEGQILRRILRVSLSFVLALVYGVLLAIAAQNAGFGGAPVWFTGMFLIVFIARHFWQNKYAFAFAMSSGLSFLVVSFMIRWSDESYSHRLQGGLTFFEYLSASRPAWLWGLGLTVFICLFALAPRKKRE
jgi:hypothetical protein